MDRPVNRKISRQEFLRFAGFVAGGAVLAACSPNTSQNPENQLGNGLPSSSNPETNPLNPSRDLIEYLSKSDNPAYNFFKVDRDQDFVTGARELMNFVATEEDKRALMGDPMDWLIGNFVPNFDNQVISDQPLDFTNAPPNPNVYMANGQKLCDHTAEGQNKDEKLGRTPDHSALSWVILAGALGASAVAAKFIQVGLEQGSSDSHALIYTAEATVANIEAYLAQKEILGEFAWLKDIARMNENGQMVINVRAAIPDVRTGYPPSIYFLGKTAQNLLGNGLKQVFQPNERELLKTAKRILQKLLSDALRNPKLQKVCDDHKLLDGIKLNKSIPVVELPDNNPFKIQTCEIFGLVNMSTICLIDPNTKTDVYIMNK